MAKSKPSKPPRTTALGFHTTPGLAAKIHAAAAEAGQSVSMFMHRLAEQALEEKPA